MSLKLILMSICAVVSIGCISVTLKIHRSMKGEQARANEIGQKARMEDEHKRIYCMNCKYGLTDKTIFASDVLCEKEATCENFTRWELK